MHAGPVGRVPGQGMLRRRLPSKRRLALLLVWRLVWRRVWRLEWRRVWRLSAANVLFYRVASPSIPDSPEPSMSLRPTNREQAEQDLAQLERDADGLAGRAAALSREFSASEIIRLLEPHVSAERMARIREVVAARTRHIVPVVEGVANTGNVNAVMRTAEGLGLQSFHVVKGQTPPKHSRRTSQGAHKWLDVEFWESPSDCVRALRASGHRIVVTHLGPSSIPIEEVDFSVPSALVFGNEKSGVSPELLELADACMVLPLNGFVQSYNISVAAAMALYYADRARRAVGAGALTPEERLQLEADFLMRAVRHAEDILRRSEA